MEKIEVLYQGGPSRYSSESCDFMLAMVDGIELYAELPTDDSDETGTYDELKKDILRQADKSGIEPARLKFYYDN